MTAPAIQTCNEELHTVREGMRALNRLLDQLDAGELEKVVLVGPKTQMRAVVLTVQEYARLVNERKG